MTLEAILSEIQFALDSAVTLLPAGGNAAKDAQLAKTLLTIITSGVTAFNLHAGEAFDITLLKHEAPLDPPKSGGQ